MTKLGSKIFVLFFFFFLIGGGVLVFSPIKTEAITGYSLPVQIRKLEIQIKKLKLILLDLQKAQIIKNKKTVQTQVKPAMVVSAPVLLSLSPDRGGNGALITLTGRNFLPQGNTIISGYADLENISSADGQTIQFSLNFPTNDIFSDEETGEVSLPGNLHLPIWLTVANKNGRSNNLVYDLQI